MFKSVYTPEPIAADAVTLLQHLLNLTGKTAASIHDVWAEGRIAERRTYGEAKDINKKTAPLIVPYAMLPVRNMFGIQHWRQTDLLLSCYIKQRNGSTAEHAAQNNSFARGSIKT